MTVDDPQVWTLIGVFAAVMLGGMTLMTSQLSRVIRAEVDRIDGILSARIDRIDGTLSARIDGLDARLGRIETKVDDLDRELTNLATRFWRSR
ncbi:hypothetical protein [Microbacterium sp. str. 'China']|uniref:hypothetical protein n=1 Tax=Microbacterium sp. str. 'China' TaxID=2103230 RepID=UPI000D012F7F|nr:hypothetical protein [Microbacterium sp. str. 'China']AVL98441.1 hypothetical protein C6C15_15795 [Microbacterium sp. str. 'China']